MRTKISVIIFLGHLFLYGTWRFFWNLAAAPRLWIVQVAMAALSVSFISATLLAFRSFHPLTRLFYTFSAVWLGFVNFCFLASCLSWMVYGLMRILGQHPARAAIGDVFLGAAVLTSAYGLANASFTRVKRLTVSLPNLPDSWRDRTAALVSDLHLGHVRGARFAQRIVKTVLELRPDAVFLTGDIYDGTAADLDELAMPFAKLSAPLGSYFVTGNHEEFANPKKYMDALSRVGVKVLNNEKISVSGMQIVGVHYSDWAVADRFRSILRNAQLDLNCASILLAHSPGRMPIAAEEGISLQLSGHTHQGQFFPFTWIVWRIYRQYAYGMDSFGKLLVYTTSGAGTWGPPMRVGTNPEVVLLRFQRAPL